MKNDRAGQSSSLPPFVVGGSQPVWKRQRSHYGSHMQIEEHLVGCCSRRPGPAVNLCSDCDGLGHWHDGCPKHLFAERRPQGQLQWRRRPFAGSTGLICRKEAAGIVTGARLAACLAGFMTKSAQIVAKSKDFYGVSACQGLIPFQ